MAVVTSRIALTEHSAIYLLGAGSASRRGHHFTFAHVQHTVTDLEGNH